MTKKGGREGGEWREREREGDMKDNDSVLDTHKSYLTTSNVIYT